LPPFKGHGVQTNSEINTKSSDRPVKIKKKLVEFLFKIFMKKFSFPKNMVRADVFRQVLWQFLSVRLPACAEASAGRRRLSDFSRGVFFAATGGENGSHYFKNTGQIDKVG